MASYIVFIISIALSYIIGSFPTSFLLAKVLKGVDIRQVGSKNAGATNVFRTVGKLPGFVTLVVDIFKGIIVVTVITNLCYAFEKNLDYDFYRAVLGLSVVCGHIWSLFLKFRGGKGVATTLGVALIIAPGILLPSLLIWIIVFFLSNYVSLASIAALASFPIFAIIGNMPMYTVIISAIICAISIYKHKDNIRRLLKGEENKTVISRSR